MERRRATYYLKFHGKDKFGIRDFTSLQDYRNWKYNLENQGFKVKQVFWQDGYPGLDGWKYNW